MKISKMAFSVVIDPISGTYDWRAFACNEELPQVEIMNSEFQEGFETVREAIKHWEKFAKANGIKNYIIREWISKKEQRVIKEVGNAEVYR